MPSKIAKQKNFERNTRLIKAFCDEYKIDLVELNDGYQLRLEDMIDLYPVRARWHNIKTGERGDWNGYKDLKRIMLAALEMIARPDKIEVKPEDTYSLTRIEKIEPMISHWTYENLWDRIIRRRTYYHRIKGEVWAVNSKKGWYKPQQGTIDNIKKI